MNFKTGLMLVALAIGCAALPVQPEDEDMSMYFDHVDPNWRIVGGVQAAEGSHPHMVAMTSGIFVRSFMCGGSVISNRAVLTAAHCIEGAYSWGSLISSLRVTVGTNQWNSGGQTYALTRNISHVHYTPPTIKYDIGILITATNIVLSSRVQPITIAANFVEGGVPVTVAGWGRIRTGGDISANLLELRTTVLDANHCASTVAAVAPVMRVEPHIEICTYHSSGYGTCHGDSGSALVDNHGQHVGIVSWGFPCAIGFPDVFVRSSAFEPWIRQNLP